MRARRHRGRARAGAHGGDALEPLRRGRRHARCRAASPSGGRRAVAPGGAQLEDSVRYTEGVHHDLHTESLASEAWCP